MLFRPRDARFANGVRKRPDAGGVEIRAVLGDREIGTHAELMALGGIYKRLYELQYNC